MAALGGSDVDAVAVSGDLTKDGEGPDLDWTRAALDGLSVPVLPVPGNHDVKAEGIGGFERRFADEGYPSTAAWGTSTSWVSTPRWWPTAGVDPILSRPADASPD